MAKMRIALIIAIMVALMVFFAVLAAGTFYCNTNLTSGGSGTYANPWACSNAEQLNYVINDLICERYGGGVLYAIRLGGYAYYDISYTDQNGQWVCNVTYQTDYPGYPPNTGGGGYPDLEIDSEEHLLPASKIGELETDYPVLMTPGASDPVLVTISIPEYYINARIENFKIKFITGEPVDRMGNDVAAIQVGEFMAVALTSPAFRINPETRGYKYDFSSGKIWQRVETKRVEIPTHWYWSIVAPAEGGIHIINVQVWICDDQLDINCTLPWFRTYEILVAKPTPIPTLTPIPTPTLTASQRIEKKLIDNSVVLASALSCVGMVVTAIIAMIASTQNSKRQAEIERLKILYESEKDPRKRKQLREEMTRINSIPKWHIW